ncbi:hypothetical protein RDABS01_030265 [Bienertia sinuspersici]
MGPYSLRVGYLSAQV